MTKDELKELMKEPEDVIIEVMNKWRDDHPGVLLDFSGVDFSDFRIEGINFSGINLRRAKFIEGGCAGADFRGADLTGALFEDADLHDADFRGATLDGADFTDVNLTGADLRGATLAGTDFRNASCKGMFFDEDAIELAKNINITNYL